MAHTTADLYNTCIALERHLREELKHKNFYEAAVRAVRTKLRSAYEALLLNDYAGSQTREVEPALWKSVYYKPIEEFRRRIKAAAAAGERGREPLQKVKGAFDKFLKESANFYRELALKLQAAYGDVGYSLIDAKLQVLPELPKQDYQQLDCSVSVYRCLICLGDICRYEVSVLHNQQKKDWSSAAINYRHAVKVFPQGGNSYNQLAVLATYSGDDLAAVYYYARSLAVAKPFTIARENLVLLLEQIRVKYSKLPPPQQLKGPSQHVSMKNKRPVNILMQEMSIRLAHLFGTLFSKVNLSDCDQILPAAVADLQDFLSREGALQALTHKASSPQGSEHVLLQVAVLSMFSLYDVTASAAAHHLGYADPVKKDVLKQAVLRVVHTVTATLASAFASAGKQQRIASAVLPTLTILLEWWAATPTVSKPALQQTYTEPVCDHAWICSPFTVNANRLVDVPQPPNSINHEVAARVTCMQRLISLVDAVQGQEQQSTAPGLVKLALAEDTQLRGFLPLQPCHAQLSFEPSEDTPQDAQPLWLHRVQVALRCIAAHEVNLHIMPEASSSAELTQAWQTFKQKVHVDSQPTASAALAAAASTGADPSPDPALAADATNAVLTVTAEAAGNVVASSAQMLLAGPEANGFGNPGQASAVGAHKTAATDALLGGGQRSASIAGGYGDAPTTLATTGIDADAVDEDEEEVILFQPQHRAVNPQPAVQAPATTAGATSYAHMASVRQQQQPHVQHTQQQQQVPHSSQQLQAAQYQPQLLSQQQQQARLQLQLQQQNQLQQQQSQLQQQNQLQQQQTQMQQQQQQQTQLQQQTQMQQQQQQQTQLQQQQHCLHGTSESYATGIAAVPPTLLPSSNLLSPQSHQGAVSSGATAFADPQRIQQQLHPQTAHAAAPGGVNQDMGSWPSAMTHPGDLLRPASVPVGPTRTGGATAETPSALDGSFLPGLRPSSSSSQLHNMASLGMQGPGHATAAPGLTETAQGQSGMASGQLDKLPGQFGMGPGNVGTFHSQYGAGPGSSAFDRPQLGGSLFSGGFAGGELRANAAAGNYHPFGNQNELFSYQQFPTTSQYPQAQSTHSSNAYPGHLSSAGSDRASPAPGNMSRTNLAAQMGLGSNPNLHSLDQLGMQPTQIGTGSNPNLQSMDGMGIHSSQGMHQPNWQQQLLQQQLQQQQQQLLLQQQQNLQQQQQQLQFPSAGGSFSHGLAGGFQNHLGHHLPPVPNWQGSLPEQQSRAGQFSGDIDALSVLRHSFAYRDMGQASAQDMPTGHFLAQHAPSSNTLNWQQQLQQQQAASAPQQSHSSMHSSNPHSGSTFGNIQQGNSLLAGNAYMASAQGDSMGSLSSPSAAAAADSWSWLDAFEQKQQSERASGQAWQAPVVGQQGSTMW